MVALPILILLFGIPMFRRYKLRSSPPARSYKGKTKKEDTAKDETKKTLPQAWSNKGFKKVWAFAGKLWLVIIILVVAYIWTYHPDTVERLKVWALGSDGPPKVKGHQVFATAILVTVIWLLWKLLGTKKTAESHVDFDSHKRESPLSLAITFIALLAMLAFIAFFVWNFQRFVQSTSPEAQELAMLKREIELGAAPMPVVPRHEIQTGTWIEVIPQGQTNVVEHFRGYDTRVRNLTPARLFIRAGIRQGYRVSPYPNGQLREVGPGDKLDNYDAGEVTWIISPDQEVRLQITRSFN